MRVEAQYPRHQAAQSKSSQSHPVIATKIAARYPVLTTRSFTIQRVLRIRLWCETRLRKPYPAMKPRAKTGVINSTSWITENLPSLGKRTIVLQCDKSATVGL
jgi:hypothetical protein